MIAACFVPRKQPDIRRLPGGYIIYSDSLTRKMRERFQAKKIGFIYGDEIDLAS